MSDTDYYHLPDWVAALGLFGTVYAAGFGWTMGTAAYAVWRGPEAFPFEAFRFAYLMGVGAMLSAVGGIVLLAIWGCVGRLVFGRRR